MFKRIIRFLGKILAAVAVAAAALFGAQAVAGHVYWASAYDGIELDTSVYAEEAADLWEVYDEEDALLLSVVDQATAVPSASLELIEECNGYIETYFLEVHDLDVSGLIDEVAVWQIDFWEAAESTISGLADPDGKNIYLSSEFFYEGSDETWFVDCYVHEMIHVLGSCEQQDNSMVYLYEGLTEYLTGLVLVYNSYDYENGSVYTSNTSIAGQIIEADDTIVTAMIGHYGEFRLDDWIDERTGGYAQELENMLFLTIYGGYSDSALLVRAQYIAAEYCKNVSPDEAREIVAADPAISFFELRSLLGGMS